MMELEWGCALDTQQFTPETEINLPMNFFAKVPDRESSISIHAIQVSEWGDTRMMRGTRERASRMEEPMGEARRLALSKSRVGWSQSLDLGSVMGMSTTLR
jgi:hypothetical protein